MATATIKIEVNGKNAERDLDRIERKLGETDKQAKRTNETMAKLGAGIGKAFAIGVTAAAGLTAATIKVIDNLDKIGKTADKIGLSTNSLQELRFAAEQSGVATTALDMGMQRFVRRTGEAATGTGVLKDEFGDLGINIKDANGTLRATDDILNDYADAIMNAGSEQEQLRLAFKAFDSEGAAMVNMLRDGAEGLQAFRDRANDLGIVIKEDLIRQAEVASDRLNELSRVMGAQMTIAIGTLIPYVSEASAALTEMMKDEKPHEFAAAVWEMSKVVIRAAAYIADGFRAIFIIFDMLEIGWKSFVFAIAAGANTIITALDKLPFVDMEADVLASNDALDTMGKEIGDLSAALDEKLLEKTFTQKAVTLIKKTEEGVAKAAVEVKKLAEVAGSGGGSSGGGAAKALNEMYDALKKMGIGLEDVSADTMMLDQALEAGIITWDQYSEAIFKAEGFTEDVAKVTKVEVTDMEQIWKNFTENTQRAFGDLFYDNFKSILEDGKLSFKSFADTILDMFLRLLAEMASAWALKGIASFFGGASGGIGSLFGSAAGSAAGGGSGILSAIGAGAKGAASWVGGLFGGGSAAGATSYGLGTSLVPAVGTPLAGSGSAVGVTSGGGIAGSSSAITTGINAVAAWAAPVAAAAIAIGGALKSAALDKENAKLTDQFNDLRLNTEEFAGELVQVNENMTLVGATADAVYVRHNTQAEMATTNTYAYAEALREMGVDMRQIYVSGGEAIQMFTGDVEKIQKIIASGFDQAKLKVKSFTTSATSSFTTMTSNFSGSMNEWSSYLQDAMDSGSVSAQASFKFIEDASGQTTLKLMGDSTEWADFMIASGRLSAEAYSTMFGEIGVAGETTFGALTESARAFQSTLNSIQAPHITSSVYDDTAQSSYGADMGMGFAHGGSFIVGGSGGTDTTPVSFMATKGERVSIETPEQQGGQQININIEADGQGLDQFIRVVADDHRVQVNRSQVRATERIY